MAEVSPDMWPCLQSLRLQERGHLLGCRLCGQRLGIACMNDINLYTLSQYKKPIGVTISSKFPFKVVGDTSPGPAAYAVPKIEQFRGKSTPKFTIASAGDRLKVPKPSKSPGPGDYVPPKSRSLSTLGGVMSSAPRMPESKVDERSPGP
eukprot:855229-Amphidinium_carterae.1